MRTYFKAIAVALVLLFIISMGAVAVTAASDNSANGKFYAQSDVKGSAKKEFTVTPGDAKVTPKRVATKAVASAATPVKADVKSTKGTSKAPIVGSTTLWEKTYDGGYGADTFSRVIARSSGSLIMVGSKVGPAGDNQAWIVKTDPAGTKIWDKSIGYAGDERFNDVKELANGNLVCVGYTSSYGSYDFYLKMLDANGNPLWGSVFGGASTDVCNSVALTYDGGFLLVGGTWSAASNLHSEQVLAVKLDAHGNLQWARTYGGNGADYGSWGMPAVGGDGYVIGGTANSWGQQTAYLIRTDKNGLVLAAVPGSTMTDTWEQFYIPQGSGSVNCQQFAKVSDGYALVGTLNTAAGSEMYLLKVDLKGNYVWDKEFGHGWASAALDTGTGVANTYSGGYVLSGRYDFGATHTDWDGYAVVTDSSGNALTGWPHVWGSGDQQLVMSGVPTSGGYVFAGQFRSTTNVGDGYLAKLST